MASIQGRAREILEAPNFCHVATLRKDGSVHTVVTWVDVEDDHVVLNGTEQRVWPRNLRRDPRVTLTIVDLENPYDFLSIRGRAIEHTNEGAVEHVDKLSKKYLGLDRYPFHDDGGAATGTRVKIVVEPEHVKLPQSATTASGEPLSSATVAVKAKPSARDEK